VGEARDESPNATAIFLDLPAPWLALPHLTRQASQTTTKKTTKASSSEIADSDPSLISKPFVSPLNPESPIHICTFSPCIEQVERTISVLRQLGWVDISMVEVAQKRLEVRRERVGIDNGTQRGVQATAATVEEALSRLREVEGRFQAFHNAEAVTDGQANTEEDREMYGMDEITEKKKQKKGGKDNPNNHAKIIESLVDRKIYKEGRLIHRTEQEIKTHTSYLVFAILPQEWTADDEAKAMAKWPLKASNAAVGGNGGNVPPTSKRQMKKAERGSRKSHNDEAKKEAALDNTQHEKQG